MSSSVKFQLVTLVLFLAFSHSAAHAKSAKASTEASARENWTVQVDAIDVGESQIDPAFRLAIYENLVEELKNSKVFGKVVRAGSREAADAPALLTLKTVLLKYVPGSETRRSVTTVTGATKIKVRIQLCSRDGQVLTERLVDGNVRFIGNNLRATHNLARNVANAMKHISVPTVAAAMPSKS